MGVVLLLVYFIQGDHIPQKKSVCLWRGEVGVEGREVEISALKYKMFNYLSLYYLIDVESGSFNIVNRPGMLCMVANVFDILQSLHVTSILQFHTVTIFFKCQSRSKYENEA